MRLDDLLGRALEERVEHVLQRRAAGDAVGLRRQVDIAQLLLLVADVPFFLEHAQLGADGGVGRLAGEVGHHLGDRRPPAPVQDVHDLPLAAAEMRRRHA